MKLVGRRLGDGAVAVYYIFRQYKLIWELRDLLWAGDQVFEVSIHDF